MAVSGSCYYRFCETLPGHRLVQSAVAAVRKLGALQDFRMPLDSLTLPHKAVQELMRLWRRMHWSSADGMMPPPELLAMFDLAYSCKVEGDYVELGCWRGLTTCYLAAACKARGNGTVFAVDTFEGTRENNTQYASIDSHDGSTLPSFNRRIAKAGYEDLVATYVGYTTDMVHHHRNRDVAFLLIDADHSYKGVKSDFESWFPLVVPGGTVVFHDYAMVDGDVKDYVDNEVVSRGDLLVEPGNVVPNVFAVTKL